MRAALPHDVKDWEVMGRTLYGEARGEPFDGLVAVAWVIRNRAESPRWWGRDVKGVCLHPLQFSCWNETDPNRKIITNVQQDSARFRRCLAVASLVLSGELEDASKGATHYFTTARPAWAEVWPPKWSAKMFETVTVGAHRFFVEGSEA